MRPQTSLGGFPVGRTREFGGRRPSPVRPHSPYDFQRLYVPEKISRLGNVISMPWKCDFHALEMRVPCLGNASSMPWKCEFHALGLEFHALGLEFHALEMSANCSGRSVRSLRSARGRSKAAQPGDISRERFSDIDRTTGAWGDRGTRRHENSGSCRCNGRSRGRHLAPAFINHLIFIQPTRRNLIQPTS